MCQNAVKCAKSMNLIVDQVITSFALNLLQNSQRLQVSIGIDYVFALMTRFETTDLDDYVFIGDAPNFAAKLQNWTARGSLRISGNVSNNL